MAFLRTLPRRILGRGPARFFVFGCTYFAAVLLARAVTIPYPQVWVIKSPLEELDYHPLTDLVRLGILVCLPPLALIALWHSSARDRMLHPLDHRSSTGRREPGQAGRPGIRYTPLICGLAVVSGLSGLAVVANDRFDHFHDDEALAPAIAIQAGASSYRDIVFVHGLFEDKHRSILAFRLFGESVGSLITVRSVLVVLAWAMVPLALYTTSRDRIGILVLTTVGLWGAQAFTYWTLSHLDRSLIWTVQRSEAPACPEPQGSFAYRVRCLCPSTFGR